MIIPSLTPETAYWRQQGTVPVTRRSIVIVSREDHLPDHNAEHRANEQADEDHARHDPSVSQTADSFQRYERGPVDGPRHNGTGNPSPHT